MFTAGAIETGCEFCSEEAAAKSLKVPLPQAMKRAAQATGVSEGTIRKIKNEVSTLDKTEVLSTPGKHRKRPIDRNCEIDDFDKCVIRQTVQDFYVQQKKVPSLKKLLPVLREKLNFHWNKESLRKVLHSMNFRWKKCANKRKFLIERPDIVFWRNNYLRKMRQSRKRAEINVNSKNRLIIVHAGSSTGFIPGAQLIYKASTKTGDYHGQMNYENFEKWVLEKLIPNLRPKSVVCMDNAPYHTKVANPTPTKYSTKKEMTDWLINNGIECDRKMRKAELYSLIDRNLPKEIIYKIDSIIKENGHYVLRLPPYHCDLNAIEYVWSSVKRLIKERNITGDLSLENLQNLLCDALGGVSSKEWEAHCRHVEKLENSYWEKDGILEEVVDELVVQIGSTESDSDSEETESCDSDSEFF
ncbi:uncharacterized protein LOC129959724 [Argiope bruennichi]|uniref:uncharacterized protein LOC129959724 n=1 Tax=Argiope bruennichi TaxID=94029 RepID=UPI002494A415|nr:uncharacterized protein LOC129959724 [Argiope bruennichi]